MSVLKDRITEDMKSALRGKETARLGTIRLLLAAMKQREVDERIQLSDADIVVIIDKMLKQRRDSIMQYEKGGRQDLVDAEKFEMTVLQAYLPAALSAGEIEAVVAEALSSVAAGGPQDMGKVMAVLKPRLAGKADMGAVSQLVKAKLTGG